MALEGAICKNADMNPAPTITTPDNEIVTIRIELRDTDPLSWRKVEVPTSITLKVLHDVIQAVMGWSDGHLWEFTIGEQKYSLPMGEDWRTVPHREATKVRLQDVLKPKKTMIDYLYDFGDCWEHRLTITGIRPGNPQNSDPHYIGGERNCPPEDCGGIPGFYEFLEAQADPGHPDHAYPDDWYDKASNGFVGLAPLKGKACKGLLLQPCRVS